MPEIRDRVKKQITSKIYVRFGEWISCGEVAEEILAIPGLAIVDRDAELPPCSIGHFSWCDYTPEDAYSQAVEDMLKAGWRKVLPLIAADLASIPK